MLSVPAQTCRSALAEGVELERDDLEVFGLPVKMLSSFCQKLSFTGACGLWGALLLYEEEEEESRLLPRSRRCLEPERERRSEPER